MTLKVCMQHRVLEFFQICSKDDPELILTYFTARSNLIPYAFVWEKGKIMDFSETVVVYDIKIGRFSLLNEYMNYYEYQRSRSFIELLPRSLRFNSRRHDLTSIERYVDQSRRLFIRDVA